VVARTRARRSASPTMTSPSTPQRDLRTEVDRGPEGRTVRLCSGNRRIPTREQATSFEPKLVGDCRGERIQCEGNVAGRVVQDLRLEPITTTRRSEMKKHVRSTRPLALSEAKMRGMEPEVLAYARGGGGQVYPGTEYDELQRSPDRA
jgi:hypothetical protein